MLGEAIPEELYPESEDVLSLSAALWADNLLSSLEGVEAAGLDDVQKAEWWAESQPAGIPTAASDGSPG